MYESITLELQLISKKGVHTSRESERPPLIFCAVDALSEAYERSLVASVASSSSAIRNTQLRLEESAAEITVVFHFLTCCWCCRCYYCYHTAVIITTTYCYCYFQYFFSHSFYHLLFLFLLLSYHICASHLCCDHPQCLSRVRTSIAALSASSRGPWNAVARAMCERETEVLRELTMRLQDVQQRHARKVREKNEKERAAMQQMGGSVEAEDDGTLGGAADARWRRTASTRRDIEVCASLGSRSVGSPCTHPTPPNETGNAAPRGGAARARAEHRAARGADARRVADGDGAGLAARPRRLQHRARRAERRGRRP